MVKIRKLVYYKDTFNDVWNIVADTRMRVYMKSGHLFINKIMAIALSLILCVAGLSVCKGKNNDLSGSISKVNLPAERTI